MVMNITFVKIQCAARMNALGAIICVANILLTHIQSEYMFFHHRNGSCVDRTSSHTHKHTHTWGTAMHFHANWIFYYLNGYEMYSRRHILFIMLWVVCISKHKFCANGYIHTDCVWINRISFIWIYVSYSWE